LSHLVSKWRGVNMVLRATCMVLVAGALAACGSSATQYSTRGMGTAVGADATVTIAEKENENFELDLKVEHLLPPDRAAPGAQSYAVWIQPDGQESPFHIGNLTYKIGRASCRGRAKITAVA